MFMQSITTYKQQRMVGYGRVSTDEEKQLYSLENQLAFFQEFAHSHNYQLIRIYADEGISGKQLKKRDEFLKMLEDAKFGLFDVVVVKDVSRFARNTVDLLTSIRALRAIGVNVLFVNNNQQTLGESEFVITLLGAMAQEESANLSKRIQFGKEVNAKRGRVPRQILGYDYIDLYTLRINEEEAALVRRIYAMYLSGMYGMAGIADQLRKENIPTKTGCAYAESYIRRILGNSIYCGLLVNHKSRTVDFINGTRRDLPEEERFHHERPELAIISKEAFDQVQEIRAERCRMQKARGGDPGRRFTSRYPFSGLVRCSECGSTMFRQNVKRKGSDRVNSYWRCKNATRTKGAWKPCGNKFYVPDQALQDGLAQALRRCIEDREAFAREVQDQMRKEQGAQRPVEERMAEVQQATQKLMRQKQKLVELYTNDLLTMEEVKEQSARITAQLDDLSRETAALNREAAGEKKAKKDAKDCVAAIENFLKLEDITNAEVRKILSRVEATPEKSLSFIFKVS